MTTEAHAAEHFDAADDDAGHEEHLDHAALASALSRARTKLGALQEQDGHWAGDYGGPLFLMPGLVIAFAVSGASFTEHQRARMVTYLKNVQRADGGWGLHVEDRSTMFGTALNYVALRLLGVAAEDPDASRARAWIRERGGAKSVPTWGKAWLSVLGVYSWEGVNPLLPELWLLPPSAPVHPSRFWCHTRAVFLPMSYLYGIKAQGPVTPLVEALRSELYLEPYASIRWEKLRGEVFAADVYSPPTRALAAMNRILSKYEARHSKLVRKRALAKVIDHIHHEDASTGYLDIGPVSKALHLACVHFEKPGQEAFRKHLARVPDYLWDGRDGMKMQGYNGSQLWDLAFTMQALLEHAPLSREPETEKILGKAFRWLDDNQVKADVPEREAYYRNPTRGCWPFSTAEQAWPVTDCTAEGLKVALSMAARSKGQALPSERLEHAVDCLLFEQNDDGGWSEYERARGSRWLEVLNAAEVFGDIMIGYSHVECTSACTQALVEFAKVRPDYRTDEVESAIGRGFSFLRAEQRPDGSFYASWAICFTYATWFAIQGFVSRPLSSDDERRVVRAMEFLVRRQRADGGWGESYLSCVEKRYVEHERSQPVQTAWALLGLMAGIEHLGKRLSSKQRAEMRGAIASGVAYLVDSQTDDGWPFDMVYGVFNKNCMINYDNYRYYFPLWALARAARLDQLLS